METQGPKASQGSGTAGRKPTLRTVAEATGFAVTTVSRALAGDERIAKSTRDTVAAAAQRLGYVPDRAAQRLRTGRTKVVTLLVNPGHEFLGFTNELLTGIGTALRGTGYSVTIIPDYITEDRIAAIRNILRQRLADGIIFTRTECFDDRVRLLMEHDFPFVTHGRTEFSVPHPYVDYDNEAFARSAVERLVAKGRTRLSMILPEPRFTFAQHLRYGFVSAVRAAGIAHEIPADVTLDSEPLAILDSIRRRRLEPDPPDGYVCVGEVVAMASLAALEDTGARHGVDADVVAKRASPIFDLYRPRIETVFEDVRQTGQEIGMLLLRRMAGAPASELQLLQQPIGSFGT